MFIKNIPNLVTISNLGFGCMGLVFLIQEKDLLMASYCIYFAMLCDFMDGFLARLLKAQSAFGKQLDSLADMVSFGLLPSIQLYWMLVLADAPSPMQYIAFSTAIFSAIRLAKFNVDDRQSDVFLGIPTPFNALLISTLPFILRDRHTGLDWPLLAGITLFTSLMLIIEIPFFSLKIKKERIQNIIPLLFLFISLISAFFLGWIAAPLIYGLYILIGIGRLFWKF